MSCFKSVALDEGLWIGPVHLQPKKGDKVFIEVKGAVRSLLDLMENGNGSLSGATLLDFVNRLARAARMQATIAIGEAVAANGVPREIARANEELVKGDGDVAVEPAKFESAITHYREAWDHAVKALGKE